MKILTPYLPLLCVILAMLFVLPRTMTQAEQRGVILQRRAEEKKIRDAYTHGHKDGREQMLAEIEEDSKSWQMSDGKIISHKDGQVTVEQDTICPSPSGFVPAHVLCCTYRFPDDQSFTVSSYLPNGKRGPEKTIYKPPPVMPSSVFYGDYIPVWLGTTARNRNRFKLI